MISNKLSYKKQYNSFVYNFKSFIWKSVNVITITHDCLRVVFLANQVMNLTYKK